MRLALIVTGGTIGSQRQEDNWISPNKEQPYRILDLFQKCYPQLAANCQFSCEMPYQILSENLNAEYLQILIWTIQNVLRQNRFDGILICHGTDTLQYTAAILAYVFSDSTIPILLVSSNYPLEDERANGLDNFKYAVETVKNGAKGVFVVYRNSDGITYVHDGIRLLAHQTFDDNLYSIHGKIAGFYDIDGNWHIKNDNSIIRDEARKVSYHGLLKSTESILWLRIYPGISYPALDNRTKVIILESYHSGTIAINAQIKAFADEARQLQIPVYLVGAVEDTSGYETIREYHEMGIRTLVNQAPIAVYCRVWLELSNYGYFPDNVI